MPSLKYGHKNIDFTFVENEKLKSHYISVDKESGVVLKGKQISKTDAQKLILKKAKWILDKLELVSSIAYSDIVTGSRVLYLGRNYYVQLIINNDLDVINVEFNESKFKLSMPNELNTQTYIKLAFETFFKEKAKEKILPRIIKLSKQTGFEYKEAKFRKLEKRWGSCTSSNNLIINYDAIKLPYSLIDYIIVHELTHTIIKSHSKAFWAELSKHIPNWKSLDERMMGMKL